MRVSLLAHQSRGRGATVRLFETGSAGGILERNGCAALPFTGGGQLLSAFPTRPSKAGNGAGLPRHVVSPGRCWENAAGVEWPNQRSGRGGRRFLFGPV